MDEMKNKTFEGKDSKGNTKRCSIAYKLQQKNRPKFGHFWAPTNKLWWLACNLDIMVIDA